MWSSVSIAILVLAATEGRICLTASFFLWEEQWPHKKGEVTFLRVITIAVSLLKETGSGKYTLLFKDIANTFSPPYMKENQFGAFFNLFSPCAPFQG